MGIRDRSKQSAASWLLLLSALVVYSLVTVLAKTASAEAFLSFRFVLFYALEFVALAVYAILWQQVLKRHSLVVAMSSKGLVVIIGLLWSALWFREQVTVANVIGSLVILVGIGMVAGDG